MSSPRGAAASTTPTGPLLRSLAMAAALSFGGVATLSGAAPVAADPSPSPRPPVRLATLVVVAGLRADALSRVQGRLTTGGLLRLRREGRELTEHWLPHLPASGAAGHATLATGALPRRHGVVAQRWYDHVEGRVVDAAQGPDGQPDPFSLRLRTVGDHLIQRHPDAKVLAVGGRRLTACLLAGRRGQAVWVPPRPGKLLAWRAGLGAAAPDWLAALSEGAGSPAWDPPERWTPVLPFGPDHPVADLRPGEVGPACMGAAFPHRLRGCRRATDREPDGPLVSSPFLDDRVLAAALAGLRGAALGSDDSPDLLLVSFASLEAVGRAFGPLSREAEDALLRLDRAVAELLAALDAQVGVGRYVALVTADHGIETAPAWLQSQGQGAGWVDLERVAAVADDALRREHGLGPWVVARGGVGLALDHRRLARAGLSAAEGAAFACGAVTRLPGVQSCWPRGSDTPGRPTGPGLGALLAAGFDPERSWDLLVVPEPGFAVTEGARYSGSAATGTGPASCHLPLWVLGPGLAPARSATPTTSDQVAPTLAAWLGLDPLPDAEGPAIAAAAPPAPPAPPAALRPPLRLTLLHTNDHHGQDRDHRPVGSALAQGGLAMRAALLRSLRRERQAPDQRVLLVDGGDVNTGPCEATALAGRASLEAMDLQGYDAMVVGNHEFDLPVRTLLRELGRVGFPALAINVEHTPPLRPWLVPARTLELGGYRVGLLGLTTPDTPVLSAHGNDPGLRFTGSRTLKAAVASLRPSVDLLVVLSHQGLQADLALAAELPAVDLIVGGHTETPTPEAIVQGRTIIVQTGYDGRNVGHAELELRPEGVRLLSYRLVPVPPADSAPWAPDPAVAALVQRHWGSVAAACSATVGVLEADFDRAPLAEAGSGSTLLHLVTDAIRWRAEADLALQNLGGVRADLPAGPLTAGHIKGALPFGNTIWTLTLTGAQIVALLREVGQRGPADKAVLYPSGLTWRFDGAEPRELRIGGRPVTLQQRYRVATNGFLARGGDGYQGLRAAGPAHDTGVTLVAALGAYLRGRRSVRPDRTPRVRRAPGGRL